MAVNSTGQLSKSNSPTFRSALSAYRAHPLLAPATDVVTTAEEEEEPHVPIPVLALVLGRVLAHARDLGLVLDRGLGPRGITGGAIPTSLRGMAEGVEVGLGLVEEAGEVDVVDIAKSLGLVLHHLVGVLYPHADGRRVTNVGGTEGADRGHLHILCVPVAHERDLTLVLVPALHVLARGRVPCHTLRTRGTVGAGAGVARVLDP